MYAFIALSLFARLAGVLFTASTAGGHGASALSVWADVSSAVAYVLIGVELLVLILLLATGRYVLAAGVALLMGFGFIYEGVHRDSAGAAGHRPAAPAATPGPRSGPAFDASGAVISFFARVEDVRKGSLSAAQLACEEMSPAAQIQIARALAGRAYGLGSCEAAVRVAARRGAFDRSRGRGYASPNVEYDQVAVARAIVLSDHRRAASYLASDGVRITLTRNDASPPIPSWLVPGLREGCSAAAKPRVAPRAPGARAVPSPPAPAARPRAPSAGR